MQKFPLSSIFKYFIFTAFVLISSAAFASLIILEKTYELKREQIISLPRSAGGQLSIRACRDCEAAILRVNGNTRYYLHSSTTELTLADWVAEDANTSNKDKLVYVFYTPDDRIVTRMILDAAK